MFELSNITSGCDPERAPLLIKREVKSFVCRNRNLSVKQRELVAEYYPLFGLPNNQDWDFVKIFSNNKPVVIEIGFGTGETLIKNAENNPNTNYIGVEVYQSGCINILNFLKENAINNLRICQGDAKEILHKYISDKALSGIQIYFPDPWPKKKHHKRRLVQTDFVNLLAKKLKTGGIVHLATDWQNYAEHMLEVLNQNSHYENLSDSDDYVDCNRELTKFEQKGLIKGHVIRDLKFKVVD